MVGEELDGNGLDAADLACFLADPQGETGRQAATRLFRRHQEKIYLWCFRYVRDHERALDLTQEVLLSAFGKLPDYVHRAHFTSWLFIIARNCCLSELRRPGLKEVIDLDPDLLQSLAPDPLQELAVQDLWRQLAGLLDTQEMDVLHLRCVEGWPVDGITEVLGLERASGARGILQRIRRKLRGARNDVHGLHEGFAHD